MDTLKKNVLLSIIAVVIISFIASIYVYNNYYNIWKAIDSNDINYVKIVLKRHPEKANDLLQFDLPRSVLQEAVLKHCDIAIIEELLKAGADINYQDNSRKTALHYAKGKKNITEFLINNRANPNIKDVLSFTPFEWECEYGNAETLEVYLKNKILLTDRKKTIDNSLAYCLDGTEHKKSRSNFGDRLDMLKLLLKYGASTNTPLVNDHKDKFLLNMGKPLEKSETFINMLKNSKVLSENQKNQILSTVKIYGKNK